MDENEKSLTLSEQKIDFSVLRELTSLALGGQSKETVANHVNKSVLRKNG